MEQLVLRLYEQEIITAGQGAFLLSMQRLPFERFLAENEIPIHSDPENIETDLANLDEVIQ